MYWTVSAVILLVIFSAYYGLALIRRNDLGELIAPVGFWIVFIFQYLPIKMVPVDLNINMFITIVLGPVLSYLLISIIRGTIKKSRNPEFHKPPSSSCGGGL